MRILIICTGNRCRSQMAQGILQHLHPDWNVCSAGTKPAAEVHPLGIKVSLIEPGGIKTAYTLPVSWLSGRMIHSCIYHPEVKVKDMIR